MRKNLMIATAVIASLALAGCQGGKKKAATETEVQKVGVKTEAARQEKVAQTVDFTANLQGNLDYFIIPAVQARIDRIYVNVGDKVKKGQLLVDLDKTQLNTYKLQLSNAESNLSRMKPVYESGGISKQQMDELETNISVLKETVANFETNLSFRSPIDGVVTKKYFEDGQLFAMSPNSDQTVGILRVMEIDKLKAVVNIPEQYLPYVRPGMSVTVTTDLYADKSFAGKVDKVSPAVNPATRSFEVEVTMDNRSLTLRPGMFARTTFNMGERESVPVHDLSVQRQPGTNNRYLFVEKNGVAERRTVTVGRQVGNRMEILSGVKAGERVITAGMARLQDGSEVEILK